MSIEIIEGDDYAVMYCDTTMTAFGPVFYTWEDEDPVQFLEWHERIYPRRDVRTLEPAVLIDHVNDWRQEREAEKREEERERLREETAADHWYTQQQEMSQ